jgi:hypothetical protein
MPPRWNRSGLVSCARAQVSTAKLWLTAIAVSSNFAWIQMLLGQSLLDHSALMSASICSIICRQIHRSESILR